MSAHTPAPVGRATLTGMLIAIGIIYGDIGTSPLYVLKAIVGERPIAEPLVLGGLSCVFWTLTLQTTLKYVVLTLRADNNGEGGIFALYTLVRRTNPHLMFLAMLGGSALLADGIITPPISVASAVEGLRIQFPDLATAPLVVFVLLLLFSLQRFGTKAVGALFGPLMLSWFLMIGALGLAAVISDPRVLHAASPMYAFDLLVRHPGGFWLLGAVFLCTTGAEALYSDLGHCGRKNIEWSWMFVKAMLLLNYFGQGAWLLRHDTELLGERNPFYQLMPAWFLLPGVVIATFAAVIASQALITGSFSLVNEAMRLNLFPKLKVSYPTELRGQIYIPALNTLLFLGCVGIVLLFRESSNMEAAYGLAITLAMLTTTVLLGAYLRRRGARRELVVLFLVIYLSIELAFLGANLEKFTHGGYVTLMISALIFGVMWVWQRASFLKRSFTDFVRLTPQLPLLSELSSDKTVPKRATHLVFMTGAPRSDLLESKVLYSILRRSPKRADTYWFLHVNVKDEPYTMEYAVTPLVPGKIIRVDFDLGFRVQPRINMLFQRVVSDLAEDGEVDMLSHYPSLRKHGMPGDFRFVVLQRRLSFENDLRFIDQLTMSVYFFLKRWSLSEWETFGLDTSSVTVETVPLLIRSSKPVELVRV